MTGIDISMEKRAASGRSTPRKRARRYGDAGAAGPRYQRQNLRETYDKSRHKGQVFNPPDGHSQFVRNI